MLWWWWWCLSATSVRMTMLLVLFPGVVALHWCGCAFAVCGNAHGKLCRNQCLCIFNVTIQNTHELHTITKHLTTTVDHHPSSIMFRPVLSRVAPAVCQAQLGGALAARWSSSVTDEVKQLGVVGLGLMGEMNACQAATTPTKHGVTRNTHPHTCFQVMALLKWQLSMASRWLPSRTMMRPWLGVLA